MNTNIEAIVYDSQRRPVTQLGSVGHITEDFAIGLIRETFNTEFGPGYSCAVSRVHSDGTREALLEWSF